MSQHVVPVRVYLLVFGALLVLTGLTVWVAFLDWGAWNTPIALTIACTKAVLVILFFMHVKYSGKMTWLFAVAGFFWLLILLTFTLSDVYTRDWLPIYGPSYDVQADPESIQQTDTRTR